MLSALDHIGPLAGGRVYSHPYSNSVGASLLPPQPSSLPHHLLASTYNPMSAAEFARPHPKPKYNNGQNGATPRNGLVSPRTKYSNEQNGPVNLAVTSNQHTTSAQLSPNTSSQSPSPKDCGESKDIDVVGLGNGNGISMAYSQNSRLSFPTSPGLTSNAYQAAYTSLYGGRYGTTGLFSPHALNAVSRQYPHRPFMPPQLDSYQSYIPPVPFSSPSLMGMSSNLPPPPSQTMQHQQQQQQQIQQHNSHNHHNGVNGLKHNSGEMRSHSTSSVPSSQMNGSTPYPLNPKEKEAKAKSDKNANFKVPSGKEGSMKHRILTRPYGEKDGKQRSPTALANNPNKPPINNISLTNFAKGSLIELANGDYRRVEDLRTDDFVQSAEKSADLELAACTVVKIVAAHHNHVMITFSYDENRSKIDLEATLEHPFFVYGQGWASCNPEGSLQTFGLKCQRLQVGDVCISLKHREVKHVPVLSPKKLHQQQQVQSFYQHRINGMNGINGASHTNGETYIKEEAYPQNLSRRPQTTPTTVLSTMMSSRSDIPTSMAMMNDYQALEARILAATGRIPSYPPYMQRPSSRESPAVREHINEQLNSSSSSSSSMNDQHPLNLGKTPSTSSGISSGSEDYLDAMSRKRRWSAPENNEDAQTGLQPPPPALHRKLIN